MRTHKLTIKCKGEQESNSVEECLDDYFCDWTHWFCGLDGAGEDTPQYCLIYRGIIHPEIITVEFDSEKIFGKNSDHEALKMYMDNLVNCGKGLVVSYDISLNDYLGVKK